MKRKTLKRRENGLWEEIREIKSVTKKEIKQKEWSLEGMAL